jgi:hypothetical protein
MNGKNLAWWLAAVFAVCLCVGCGGDKDKGKHGHADKPTPAKPTK